MMRPAKPQSGLDAFEHSVFDNAIKFSLAAFHGRGKSTRVDYALDLAAAIEAARLDERSCIYAVSAAGRHMVVDRAKWNYWLNRKMAADRAKAGLPRFPQRGKGIAQ